MKIILQFLLVALIMWPLYTQSKEPVPAPLKTSKEQQNKPSPKQAESKDHQRGTDNLPFVVKIVKTSPAAQKESDNTKNSDNKPSSDWRIIFDASLVIFNGLLAAFTLGLFVSTRKMWKSTEKAANAANAAAEALPLVERAYVFVTIKAEEMKFIDKFAGEPIYDFRITIMMWNYGKTPAVINRILKKIYFDEPLVPDTEDPEAPSGIVLGTGNNGSVPIPHSEEIAETKRKGIIICDIIPYCCGRVEYEDIFGNSHFTDFCWEFSSSTFCDSYAPGGGEWNASRKYKEMNKRT